MKSLPRLFYKLVYTGILCLGTQCKVDVENNQRYLISGSVQDTEANPLPNIHVTTYTQAKGFFSNSGPTYIFGANRTDANGKYQFTSLVPNRALSIRINHPEDSLYQENRITRELRDIPSALFTDFQFDTPSIILPEIIQGTFKIFRKHTTEDILNYEVYRRNTLQSISMREPNSLENREFLFSSETLFPMEKEKIIEINNLVEKDTLRFVYSLKNRDRFIQDSIGITPTQNNTYVFEF